MQEDSQRPPVISIVGVGLMGGSLALAWRQARFPARVIGVGRRAEPLMAAERSGALDAWTHDLASAVSESDIVVIGTPVLTILELLPEIGRHARPGSVILDLGSSKSAICSAMESLPAEVQPVGGHPLCGKELAGFDAAEAKLLHDRPFVICPLTRTAPWAVQTVKRLALAAGARPIVLEAEAHDWAVAAISHLPYVVAVSLVEAVSGGADSATRALAASGFRDTTRVASSDPRMMLDTLLTNRAAVLEWLDEFASELGEMRAAVASGDATQLRGRLESARSARAELARVARW